MRIEEITLRNFRNFQEQTFQFPSLFTVVIGENGKGKSTLLQSLKVAAGTFLLGLKEAERIHILSEDIRRVDLNTRFAPQFPCEFMVKGDFYGQPVSWKRSKNTLDGRTTSADANELIGFAQVIEQRVNENLEEKINLPVLGFFSTARLWAESKQTFKLKTKGSRLKDGYARCLDQRSDRITPMEWIKSNYYKQLKGADSQGLLKAVLEAISTCIPNWTAEEWDEDTDDLFGTLHTPDGQLSKMPLYYLSDGLRTMAGLVAEIAYRCVILNSHLGEDAVKQSKGIVLIDELDMHLHPNWQRHVVNDLKTAFPNIQFVATTHSPFIVQSLNSNELINLDAVSDVSPKELTVEEVAQEIMGVESAYSIENTQQEQLSKTYFETLETGTLAEPTTRDTLEEIEVQIADPAMRALLQMKKLKKQLNPEQPL